jgi:hypothetical protein
VGGDSTDPRYIREIYTKNSIECAPEIERRFMVLSSTFGLLCLRWQLRIRLGACAEIRKVTFHLLINLGNELSVINRPSIKITTKSPVASGFA